MKYKKCYYCNANLDHGEICDCRTEAADKTKIDFADILSWAKANENKYPALTQLREETIGVSTILRLDVPLGGKCKKQGIIITSSKAIADMFRRDDYMAAVGADNNAVKKYLKEWAIKWAENHRKKKEEVS